MSAPSKDLVRLRAILQLMIQPFVHLDRDDLTNEDKLWYAMNPKAYPIYRRKLLGRTKVSGLWWVNESQWTRYSWKGHKNAIIRSTTEPDRVMANRTFLGGGFCYIRENKGMIDIEALSDTPKWDPIKKKCYGHAYEWLTVTISPEEYKRLDTLLGPRDDGCSHEL